MAATQPLFYDPAAAERSLPHSPFKAIVAPRPIGWISSRDGAGRVNLAPYSFFNAMGDEPPVVAFSSSGRKDSLHNVEATGEFVANLATEALADAVNGSAAPFAPGEDEMRAMGLTPASCRHVDVPRVAESPAALECRVLQIVHVRDLQGRPTANHIVIGQVVGIHVDPAFLVEGRFDTAAARPLLRAGYLADYAVADRAAMRTMSRPKTVDEALAKVRGR